jgi:hypothetical protein
VPKLELPSDGLLATQLTIEATFLVPVQKYVIVASA